MSGSCFFHEPLTGMMLSVPRDHYVSAGFRLIRFRLILMLCLGLWCGGRLGRSSLMLLLRRSLMLLLRGSLVLLLRRSLMLLLRCRLMLRPCGYRLRLRS